MLNYTFLQLLCLPTNDSVNLTKKISKGFKRSAYWNRYQTKPAKVIEKGKNLYELLNAAFQGVRRLFDLAYFVSSNANDEAGIKGNKKYFLPRGEIKSYNVLIDRRSLINQLMT